MVGRYVLLFQPTLASQEAKPRMGSKHLAKVGLRPAHPSRPSGQALTEVFHNLPAAHPTELPTAYPDFRTPPPCPLPTLI